MNFIQKIRDYGFQKYMKEYYRESRDLWMSATISKARELELMERVADNWQAKLIEQNAIIGKRIKFSVGNNKVEIVIGNPVTVCYFVSPDSGLKDFNDEFMTVSICHKNDVFDWKRGAVEALENMVHNYLGTTYGDPADYYNTLFTAYPEIGIQPVEPKKPVKKAKKATK
jgi:hypothetical protein